MTGPDFEDFMLGGGWDLLFPDEFEDNYTCPFCGRVIQGREKVEWVDKNLGIFKCPECGEEITIG